MTSDTHAQKMPSASYHADTEAIPGTAFGTLHGTPNLSEPEPTHESASPLGTSVSAPHNFASMSLHHTLSVQKIEGWEPSVSQYRDLYRVAHNLANPRVLVHDYATAFRTPENMYQKRRLFTIKHPYYYPGDRVLKNKLDITNQAALNEVEAIITSIRIIELYKRAFLRKVSRDSLEIRNLHVSVFGDIYHWAGYFREIGLNKGGDWFAPISIIEESINQVDSGIRDLLDKHTKNELDHDTLAHNLAQLYAIYNYAHPFREGNGRNGMTWLEMVALSFGWHLDFSSITQADWYTASRAAMPKSRLGQVQSEPLFNIFSPNLHPITAPRTADAI